MSESTANGEAAEPVFLSASRELKELLERPESEQSRLGYVHTLREILQQPDTWRATGEQVHAALGHLKKDLDGMNAVVLTGSGSSEFVGECCRPIIQNGLNLTTQVIGSGDLLTHGMSRLPVQRPALMVSFARSGDSPESVGALSLVQSLDPAIHHLVITCNRNGQLATKYGDKNDVDVVVLDERTNDHSLVMTSSFTNMVLAASALGMLDAGSGFLDLSKQLSAAGEEILQKAFAQLHSLGQQSFSRAFYLASPSLTGTARESALKMLEMTSGGVMTVDMTYLGLRHGPMSGVSPETVVVCFLSSDPLVRAYEADVIRELNQKNLGLRKLIVGSGIPADLAAEGDICLEHEGFQNDLESGILYVLVGQVLAFYRCMREGLQPDEPSAEGVINRVVQGFRIYSF
ncbi:MAG: SIS domain-containing protein [Acidobacteria bacterium]|nr:SIS domain-containing protein [Acidobacteriota bacterium]